MSRHFTFDCHEDYTEAAHIEALLLLRGGRILDAVSGVALALLDDRLVVVQLDGPLSGNYALLSQTGPGRLKQLSDRLFLEWVEEAEAAASARRGQRVVDLAEGETRLREVMQAIQDEVAPQASALIAARAQELNATEEGRGSPPEPPSRAACFEALAAFFDMGGYSGAFPHMAGIVRGLLKNVSGPLAIARVLPAASSKPDEVRDHPDRAGRSGWQMPLCVGRRALVSPPPCAVVRPNPSAGDPPSTP